MEFPLHQFNSFVFDLNNRLQHLPLEVRQRQMKKVLDDLSGTLTFTPPEDLADPEDDFEDEQENIACENAMGREDRIKQLINFYGVQGDTDESEEEALEREHVVKKRCGKTDLHEAVMMGDLPLIRQLISEGADVNAKNNNGHTAIYLAFLEENEAVIGLLRELGIISATTVGAGS
jgi:hypothetical protein